MKAVDFFCGIGGLTRGLIDAGIDVVCGIDNDERCAKGYEYNNPQSKFVNEDIKNLDRGHLKLICGVQDFDEVLFAGCAPCQPFSPLRKNQVRGNDGTLLGEFGRLVMEAQPGYVLIENVPGIARVRGYSTFCRFVRMLEENRYHVVYGVLDAKYFGVPQSRKRLLLIAAKNAEVTLPRPRYGKARRPIRTVRDAISRFPAIAAGESHPTVANHSAAAISTTNLERLRATPLDGGDRRSWPDELLLACQRRNSGGYYDIYGRMRWDSPSPTLTGRCHSISNGRYGHPEQDRAISLREAASLQSFPDGYVFFGTNKRVAQQIGNAVPPVLAESIGKHVLRLAEPGRPGLNL